MHDGHAVSDGVTGRSGGWRAPSLLDRSRGGTESRAERGGRHVERIIGRREGRKPGPMVIVTGGVHGNEPAGLSAIQAVLASLGDDFAGTFVGVGANLQALARDERYLDRDLNRRWSPEELERLLDAAKNSLVAEDREQRELHELFGDLTDGLDGPAIFIDLHTMSGPGAPFACMADVLRNRRIAFTLPIPVVLGLEEVIEGSMLGYLCDLGHVGIAVEGGQHHHPQAAAVLEASVWLCLVAAGVLEEGQVPNFEDHYRRLEEAARDLPRVLEIRHRHVCRDGDGFEMVPGFSNFQPVRKGVRLARDVRGDVSAPHTGLLMLPRYQGAGSDGFFMARPVRRFWLDLSARLRRARADRVLPTLPGVFPHPHRPETFLVDPRVARIKVIQIFHLFGYRRMRPEGSMLAFSRRRPDDQGPAALPAPSAS